MSDDPGQREVAYRLFATEYDDANYTYSESDEERAPNYVITPTGARVNRLFVVGVLTEVEAVSENTLRGRVADPTGAFVLYAGQYEPDEQATLEQTDPPAFVAVTGKADTFQPDDGDQVYTSIRPESINTVDAETRDRWTVQTAEQTLSRVGHVATALSTGLAGGDLRDALADRGVDPALADGIPRALAHYDTTPAYLDGLRTLALDAARVVAGAREEVRGMTAAPDDPGEVTAAELVAATPDTDVSQPARDESGSNAATGGANPDTAGAGSTTSGAEPETTVDPGTAAESEATSNATVSTEPGAAVDSGTAAEPEGTAGSEGESEPETTSGSGGAETAPGVGAEPENGADDLAVETGTSDEDLGEFDSGEFELPDEVREEVEEAEEEFGTTFQSGTEVEEPGEADIQTPEAQTETDSDGTPADTTAADTKAPGDAGTAADTSPEESTATETAGTEPVDAGESADDENESVEDPQAAVLAVMEELGDGSGADRAAVVEETRNRHGFAEEAVEAAIQDALMDGECYEPDESSLKPI